MKGFNAFEGAEAISKSRFPGVRAELDEAEAAQKAAGPDADPNAKPKTRPQVPMLAQTEFVEKKVWYALEKQIRAQVFMATVQKPALIYYPPILMPLEEHPPPVITVHDAMEHFALVRFSYLYWFSRMFTNFHGFDLAAPVRYEKMMKDTYGDMMSEKSTATYGEKMTMLLERAYKYQIGFPIAVKEQPLAVAQGNVPPLEARMYFGHDAQAAVETMYEEIRRMDAENRMTTLTLININSWTMFKLIWLDMLTWEVYDGKLDNVPSAIVRFRLMTATTPTPGELLEKGGGFFEADRIDAEAPQAAPVNLDVDSDDENDDDDDDEKGDEKTKEPEPDVVMEDVVKEKEEKRKSRKRTMEDAHKVFEMFKPFLAGKGDMLMRVAEVDETDKKNRRHFKNKENKERLAFDATQHKMMIEQMEAAKMSKEDLAKKRSKAQIAVENLLGNLLKNEKFVKEARRVTDSGGDNHLMRDALALYESQRKEAEERASKMSEEERIRRQPGVPAEEAQAVIADALAAEALATIGIVPSAPSVSAAAETEKVPTAPPLPSVDVVMDKVPSAPSADVVMEVDSTTKVDDDDDL